MKKKFKRIGGVILLIIAVLLLFVSLYGFVMINGVTGPDGYISSEIHPFTTYNYALSSYDITIDLVGTHIPSYLAWLAFDDGILVRLTLSTDTSKDLFIGLGHAQDVHTYLDDIDYYIASNYTYWINPFEVSLEMADFHHMPGDAPLQFPENETFWLLTDSGSTTVSLHSPMKDGVYRLVLMNADGSADIDVGFQISAQFPFATRTIIFLVVIGAILGSCGVYLLFGEKLKKKMK